MTEAVIFDCWNTLFEDEDENPFKKLAERLGFSLDNYEYVKTVEKHMMLEKHENFEEPLKELMDNLEMDYSEDLLEEAKEILWKGTENIRPFPETMEVLEDLKGRYKLGLISNTDYLGFGELERKYNVREIFDKILTSYEIGIMKPNPKIFELMIEGLGVDKGEVVMVGDFLPDDVQAAEDFGIKGILIDRDNSNPDYPNRIESLKELKDFL